MNVVKHPLDRDGEIDHEDDKALKLVLGLVDMFVKGGARLRASERTQFEVLMQHFLPRIDVFSRAVVAQKLGPCSTLPLSILDMLALDADEVAEPIITSAPSLPPSLLERIRRSDRNILQSLLAERERKAGRYERVEASEPIAPASQPAFIANAPVETNKEAPPAPHPLFTEPAPELAQAPPLPSSPNAFFEAGSKERQDYLLRLTEFGEGEAPAPAPKESFQYLLRLLALRQHDGAAEILSDLLDLPAPLTRRMIDDPHGEALVAIGRFIGLDEEQFLRLALLGNAQVGRAVERVYALRALYRKTSPQACAHLFSLWRQSKGNKPRFAVSDNRRLFAARLEKSPAAAPKDTQDEQQKRGST